MGLNLVRMIVLTGFLVLPWSTLAQDQGDSEATIAALQTEVARLQDGSPTPVSTTPEASEPPASETSIANETGEPSAQRAVNLEIILDVSGSMGQVIDTGETRMDAAKRVLNEVMAVVPEEPGINVGLRFYGHLGDNSEAGRAVSCQASDLVVPVSGVDRQAIAQQIAPLVPTGWTPIGLSLERSAEDFPSSGADTNNAVVLVTDGLETCGGDPAAAAGSLLSGEKGIVTHVIGFALTPDEQQILQSIAGASGGMLLGAGNANELSAALFSVLEELEIVVGHGYMGGNAFSLIPAGEEGEISVVAHGSPDPFSSAVPFVVRNNTDQSSYDVRVSAVAKDAAGRVLMAGDDQGVRPFHIAPGTLGLGHIYFDGVEVPADATFEFRVESADPDELRYTRTRDLEVAEASIFEDRIVGQMENPQDGTMEGILGITVTCFDLAGYPLGDYWEFIETNELAPGLMLPFQASLYGIQSEGCPAFLVAGSGQCASCSPIVTPSEPPRAASQPADSAPNRSPELAATPDAREAAMLAQDPLSGYTDAATRYLRFNGGSLSGIVFLPYSILQFDNQGSADAALEETVKRYLEQRDEPILDLVPSPAPNLGDRAIAFTGKGDDPQFDIRVAILAIRSGDRIHFLIGSQINNDPLPLLEEVASVGLIPVEERLLNEQTLTGLNAGDLWDIVPRPEDLGDGYTVEDEFVPKMFGPFADGAVGTPPAPDIAVEVG